MDILTMNQNVFGSSFETIRRSDFTEQAINNDLIIPDSAVELSYEEMEYVDGGAVLFNYYLSNSQAWDAVSSLYSGYNELNKALITGGVAGVAATILASLKNFVVLVKLGAVPVIGWALVIAATAVGASIATVLAGALITGKGFGITVEGNPVWYNPFRGMEFDIGWR